MVYYETLAERKFDQEPHVAGGMPGQWYILACQRITDEKITSISIKLVVKQPEYQHGTVTHYVIDDAIPIASEATPAEFLDDFLYKLFQKEYVFSSCQETC